MKLPDKIIKLRKAHGWSQEDFAENRDLLNRAGYSTISCYTVLPALRTLIREKLRETRGLIQQVFQAKMNRCDVCPPLHRLLQLHISI